LRLPAGAEIGGFPRTTSFKEPGILARISHSGIGLSPRSDRSIEVEARSVLTVREHRDEE